METCYVSEAGVFPWRGSGVGGLVSVVRSLKGVAVEVILPGCRSVSVDRAMLRVVRVLWVALVCVLLDFAGDHAEGGRVWSCLGFVMVLDYQWWGRGGGMSAFGVTREKEDGGR